ncbi:hypothetical protein TURU_006152 [Turdus rufiventris]|nr:hypothetical protein TURU_006152 [Turdus rufiventris]
MKPGLERRRRLRAAGASARQRLGPWEPGDCAAPCRAAQERRRPLRTCSPVPPDARMASVSQKRIIQITGFTKKEKVALVKCLFKLNCVFIESKNEIQNPKDTQMNHFQAAQETDQVMHKMQLAEMKNVIIKHMYFTAVRSTDWSRGTWSVLQGLVEEDILDDVVTELAAGRMYSAPPVKLLHPLLRYVLLVKIAESVCILNEDKVSICLVEGTNSQHQQTLPQTVLLKTFFLESGTAVLFTKHINILADWVIFSHRELNGKNDAFRREIAGLLNAILGTIVDYWIISGLVMDRNLFHQVPDLTHYLVISCEGETALHKACRNNKVERLIQLLSLPGTDINVRDYAGWTPLHEACNHGSTVCVREILERCPEVDLLSQVDGMTPLHDALSNGHVEIGKLLLQHGGPVLLEQRNSHDELPLDYVESDTVKEELLNLVYPGESIENFYKCREQDFCNQKKELCLISFTKMLLNFCSVYNLSTPLTVTLRAVACSDVLPVMVCNSSKMKYAFSGDWLVDTYFKELETFEKLPQFFQEISGNLLFFPGEHAKALLAVLETMVEPCQVPKCFQKLNSKQATLAES